MASFEVEEVEEVHEAHGIEKAGPACGICCLGWLVFPIALFVLGYNEKSYVCTNKNILMASEKAEELGPDACTSTTPPSNKFIFFSCPLDTTTPGSYLDVDMTYLGNTGFTNPKAINFKTVAVTQTVEMLQCKEDKSTRREKRNGKTVDVTSYTYDLSWSETGLSFTRNPSSSELNKCLGYKSSSNPNPGFPTQMVTKDERVKAGDFKAGPFKLFALISKYYYADTTVPLASFKGNFLTTPPTSTVALQETPEQLRFLSDDKQMLNATSLALLRDTATLPTTITDKTASIDGDYVVTCASTNQKVGCLRASWKQNNDKYASVIANSGTNGILKPEPTEASWGCSADEYYTSAKVQTTKAKILEIDQSSNDTSLMMIRVVGIVGAWLAIYCCFYPIVAMADIMQDYAEMVPCVGGLLGFIGEIMEDIVQMIVCCFSCALGCSSALFVVAIVWIVMRPLTGIALMVVCICLCGGVYGAYTAAPKKNAPQPDPDPEEQS